MTLEDAIAAADAADAARYARRLAEDQVDELRADYEAEQMQAEADIERRMSDFYGGAPR